MSKKTGKHLEGQEKTCNFALAFAKQAAKGRLAQLVQSVCLTSRGSGVRIPQRPREKRSQPPPTPSPMKRGSFSLRPMKHPIRHYLSKFKYIIAIVIFLVSIGFIGEHSITERLKRKQEIATLQSKIAEQQRKFEEDNRVLEQLKSDPDAVRRVAREKYFMKRSNEDVFIIEDE